MRKTSLFVKFAFGLLIALFVFVSCSDTGINKNNEVTLGVALNDSSKGLSASYGAFDPADYYWYYKTTVTGYTGTPSTVEFQTLWTENGSTGLAGGQRFGIGTWTLELWAYKDDGTGTASNAAGLSYYGKAQFKVSIDEVTGNVTEDPTLLNDDGTPGYRVYVPMQYVDGENNDDDINFSGEPGKISYSFEDVATFEGDAADYDGNYDFTKYTTITSINDPSTPLWVSEDGDTEEIDTKNYTSFSALPGTYSISTVYDSLGVFYKVTDTVDVHSNKTVTVTGSFENRERKSFTVYFHDGKVLNEKDEEAYPSSDTFSGNISAINATYKEKEGVEFFDGVTEEGIPYKNYTFEDILVLPYVKTTTDTSFRENFGFWGWYTSDADWHISDKCNTSESNGFKIRTSGTVVNDAATTQTIFVDQVADADADFETAYGLTIAQVSEDDMNTAYAGPWDSADYVYEIHLYARWIDLKKTVGVSTSPSDMITLWDTRFGKLGQDGYVHLSIVDGVDKVQGWTGFDHLTFYVGKKDGKVYATTNSDQAYTEYFIDGWYTNEAGSANGKILVITNDGTLARYSEENAGVQKFVKADGTWKYQGAEVMFYAHWSTKDAE